jgi:hypothetical protein
MPLKPPVFLSLGADEGGRRGGSPSSNESPKTVLTITDGSKADQPSSNGGGGGGECGAVGRKPLCAPPITQQEAHKYYVSENAKWLGAGANGSTKLVRLGADRTGGRDVQAVVKLHSGTNSWMPAMIDGVNRLHGLNRDYKVDGELEDNAWTSEVFARREAFYHQLAWLRFCKNDEWLARQLSVPACMDFEPTTAPMVYYIRLEEDDDPKDVVEWLEFNTLKDAAALQNELDHQAKQMWMENGTVKVTNDPATPTVVQGKRGVVCVTLEATFYNASGEQPTEKQHELIAATLARALKLPNYFVQRAYYTVQGMAELTSAEQKEGGFTEPMVGLGRFLRNCNALSKRGAWAIATAYGRLCGAMHRHGIFHGDLHSSNVLVFPRKATHLDFLDDPIRWRVIDWGMSQTHTPLFDDDDQDGGATSCEYKDAFKRLAKERDAAFARTGDDPVADDWPAVRNPKVWFGVNGPSGQIKHPPGLRVRPRETPGYDGAPHGDTYDFHIQPPGSSEDAHCRGERQSIYRRLGIVLPQLVRRSGPGSEEITVKDVTEWIWTAYEQAIGKKEGRPQRMWPEKEENGAILFEATLPPSPTPSGAATATATATATVASTEGGSWMDRLRRAVGWGEKNLAEW